MRSLLMATLTLSFMAITSFSYGQLVVTSNSFKNNASIPLKYSCEGAKINPALKVTKVPAGAKSLALILHDPDANAQGGFTHWVLWNIDVHGNIPEDFKGGVQGLNGAKQTGYRGPCPPTGAHHYHFMVYALDTQLDLDQHTDKAGLEKAMEGHILAKGDLVGLYQKAKP